MIQYQKITQDQQLENKIREIQLNFLSPRQEYQGCQIINELRKPVYQNHQIKQILYQNTQSNQLHQLLLQTSFQPIYYLFLTKILKIVMKIQGSNIDIKQYSKVGKEKFQFAGQIDFIYNQNLLNIAKNNKQSILKIFKSLKHPINVEKLLIIYQIRQPNQLLGQNEIYPEEFLLQI
ncbi:hypothetical protein pb186bvf_012414 [Paramecium bursaria]